MPNRLTDECDSGPFTDAALARPGTRVFDMTGRPMRGWILVAGTALSEDDVLGEWVDEGRAFAVSLPPK
ncbi:hypothetical protein IQ64_37710 [Streptomyces stelliscabiei]|nr:hypothetical protein IQ64_37710 [Streptomyces stelliscabiei]